MQRFDARLVNDACGNKDVLMKETFDGLFVRYEDVEAELATLRSENERLKAVVDRLCTEMEYIHEASYAVESDDVRCLIRTSEGEGAIAQARALLTQATQKGSE